VNLHDARFQSSNPVLLLCLAGMAAVSLMVVATQSPRRAPSKSTTELAATMTIVAREGSGP
jgi:hypothetical protein